MKTGMQVDQFLAEIAKRDAAKLDYVAPQASMGMTNDGSRMAINGLGEFELTDIAHGQLAERMRIPRAYYDRCGEIPGLRASNVNGWMHNGIEANKTRRTIRTMDGRARAILSDRYRPLDNILIVGAALPVLAANPDLVVKTADIGEARMYLQVVLPKLQAEIAVGDAVQYGFTITNSEVGMGAVDVKSFVYRLVCKNGMVGESVTRRYHVGRRVGNDEEDYSIFTDETIEAELKSFQLRLRDTITATLNQTAFDALIEKMRKGAADKVEPMMVQDTVQNITKRYSMNDLEMAAVYNRVMVDGGFDRWRIANAITAQAHDTASVDRQYDLERIGYDLAVMAPKDFRALVAA